MKLSTLALQANLLALPSASSAFVVGPFGSSLPKSSSRLFGADEFAFQTVPAAQKYSGGPVEVDMNIYNLSLEQATEEWTASRVVNSAVQKDGVYLEPKSNRLVYCDVITCRVLRQPGQGLGIELLELAGGRDDGVGITVVSGLVEGSVSENSGLKPGDSITQMAVVTGKMEMEQAVIDTECCNWDKTVELIGSLPPATEEGSSDEALLVTVKRLRRKPIVEVKVQQPESDSSQTLELFAGENLRRAMLNQGVKLNDKYAKAFNSGDRDAMGDCGSEGGCGMCTVAITEGAELLNNITDDEKNALDGSKRWSCRSIVGHGMKEGKITVRLVNPES